MLLHEASINYTTLEVSILETMKGLDYYKNVKLKTFRHLKNSGITSRFLHYTLLIRFLTGDTKHLTELDTHPLCIRGLKKEWADYVPCHITSPGHFTLYNNPA